MTETSKRAQLTVVISGATRGLGRALVTRLVEMGHVVAGCGRSAEGIDALRADPGPPHRFDVLDVTDAEAVRRWAHQIRDTVCLPDLVIANAGLIHEPKVIWEIEPDVFDVVLRANVTGVYAMARAFLPLLTERGGTLVTISSGWGRSGRHTLAPYCASKFAVEGLTQSVAAEVPASVKVVSLDPGGGVNTDMLATCLPDEYMDYPSAETWAKGAVDYLIDQLPRQPNGACLTVPHATSGIGERSG